MSQERLCACLLSTGGVPDIFVVVVDASEEEVADLDSNDSVWTGTFLLPFSCAAQTRTT